MFVSKCIIYLHNIELSTQRWLLLAHVTRLELNVLFHFDDETSSET